MVNFIRTDRINFLLPLKPESAHVYEVWVIDHYEIHLDMKTVGLYPDIFIQFVVVQHK